MNKYKYKVIAVRNSKPEGVELVGRTCKVVHILPDDPYRLMEFDGLYEKRVWEKRYYSDKYEAGSRPLQWYIHFEDLCYAK